MPIRRNGRRRLPVSGLRVPPAGRRHGRILAGRHHAVKLADLPLVFREYRAFDPVARLVVERVGRVPVGAVLLLFAGHGDEEPVVAVDHLQVAHDETVVEDDRGVPLELLVVGHGINFDLGDIHLPPPPLPQMFWATNSARPPSLESIPRASHAAFALPNNPNTAEPLPESPAALAPAAYSSFLISPISGRAPSQAPSKSLETEGTRSSQSLKAMGSRSGGGSSARRCSLA